MKFLTNNNLYLNDNITQNVLTQNEAEKTAIFIPFMEGMVNGYGYTFGEDISKLKNIHVDDLNKIIHYLKSEYKIDINRTSPLFSFFLKRKAVTKKSLSNEEVLYMKKVVTMNAHIQDIVNSIFNIEVKENVEVKTKNEKDKTKNFLKEIKIINKVKAQEILKNMAYGATSLSLSDYELLKEVYNSGLINFIDFNEKFNSKINFSLVMKIILDEQHFLTANELLKKVNNANDYLRVLALMSNENDEKYNTDIMDKVCLSKGKYSFKNMNKEVNFYLLWNMHQYISNKPFVTDDFFLNRNIWIAYFNYNHIGSSNVFKYNGNKITYSTVFKNIVQDVYKNNRGNLFNGVVEKNDFVEKVNLLKVKPGVFAKKISELLNNQSLENSEFVLNAFNEVIDSVSNTVLLKLNVFAKNKLKNPAYIIHKARVFPIFVNYENINKKKDISSKVLGKLSDLINNELLKRFSNLEKMGNVFIDDSVKNINVLFNKTKAQKSINTLALGSKFKFDNSKYIRLFNYWKDYSDLDLSAAFYDKDGKKVGYVAYYQLQSKFASHSGDIRTASDGAAEYIDINTELALKNNVQYISVYVNNYSGKKFSEMEICKSGVMLIGSDKERKFAYQEDRVLLDADMVSDSCNCHTLIIDIVNNEIVWVDLPVKSDAQNTTEININLYDLIVNKIPFNPYRDIRTLDNSGEEMIFIATMCGQYAKYFDLVELHAKSRGGIVKSLRKADVVFSLKSNADFIKNENERRKKWNEKNPDETQLKDLVVYSPYDFDVVSKDFIIN